MTAASPPAIRYKQVGKWFGPKGELPCPMSAGVRTFMLYQAVSK